MSNVCRRWGAALSLILATAVLSTHSSVHAAPVLFQFEAIVHKISPLNGNAVPIPVELGDRVHAEFTFQPLDASASSLSTNTIQDFPAEFEIRSTRMITEAFVLNVADNTPIDDAPPDQTADHIFLGSSGTGFADSQSNPIPNDASVRWDFSLSMYANGGTLDGPDISGDPALWNQFLPSTLVLILRAADGTDLALVASSIESFVSVPEPRPDLLFVLAGFTLLSIRKGTSEWAPHAIH